VLIWLPVIAYRFCRIPALPVENGLLDLPYISEACVLGVPHTIAKELCAAVVRLRPDSNTPPDLINLGKIRLDLSKTLSTYMLPTLLRILRDDETLPLTSIGKPIKKEIRRDFFKTTDWWPLESPPADVEYWSNKAVTAIGEKDLERPWDWCAMQMAD
jgi:malonyl-CoA/methylmalonyl-CoA synthetase